MCETVQMSAAALRYFLGGAFDYEKFEHGRQDTWMLFVNHPEQREERLEEIKRRIECCDFKNVSGPSYWVGCLNEVDFL